jgi:hypothetical protein
MNDVWPYDGNHETPFAYMRHHDTDCVIMMGDMASWFYVAGCRNMTPIQADEFNLVRAELDGRG